MKKKNCNNICEIVKYRLKVKIYSFKILLDKHRWSFRIKDNHKRYFGILLNNLIFKYKPFVVHLAPHCTLKSRIGFHDKKTLQI